MSEMKSKQVHAPDGSMNPGVTRNPEKPGGSRAAIGGGLGSAILQRYALYAPPLYPCLMQPDRDSLAGGEDHLARHRGTRALGPGSAANDLGANDNPQAQPLPAPTSAAGLGRVVAAFARLWRYVRREREIARSIALLSNLDDHTLRDLGIHRSQIPQAVRHGRDEWGGIRTP